MSTCDFYARPNVAPKFLLKIKEDYIYLVDYVLGRTYSNLCYNPVISLSMLNMDTLTGYQINGDVEIIEKGAEYKKLLDEYRQKKIRFSTDRIIEGLHKEEKHKIFETILSEQIAVFKIRVKEIIEIIPTGKLKRKKLEIA